MEVLRQGNGRSLSLRRDCHRALYDHSPANAAPTAESAFTKFRAAIAAIGADDEGGDF